MTWDRGKGPIGAPDEPRRLARGGEGEDVPPLLRRALEGATREGLDDKQQRRLEARLGMLLGPAFTAPPLPAPPIEQLAAGGTAGAGASVAGTTGGTLGAFGTIGTMGMKATVLAVVAAGAAGGGYLALERRLPARPPTPVVERAATRSGPVIVPTPSEAPAPTPPPPARSERPAPRPQPARPAAVPPKRTAERAPPAAVDHPAPAVPTPSPAQAAELSLLERAYAEVKSEPGTALALTRQHESRYPQSPFAQEREAIAIEALVALGRIDDARARAGRFLRLFPSSALRRRVERSLP